MRSEDNTSRASFTTVPGGNSFDVYSHHAAPDGDYPANARGIENLATVPRFRNRGLARATVLAAAAAAQAAGNDLVFIVADAADWPLELYRRLGFDELGSEWSFGRPG